jgi:predicted acyl esterase
LATRGELVARSTAQPADGFRYDPSEPAFNEGVEGELAVSERYLTDDRSFVRLAGDGLIYDSAPYPRATLLTGRPSVVLNVALDVPDTDIRVQLFEIASDERTIFLGQDYIRARYRNGPRRAEFAKPGRSERYVFDQFPFIARSLRAGSRIRLVISPLGASIHQQRNRNSGGVVADETADDNRVAHVRIGLGPRLSHVVVPLGAGEGASR